LSFFEFSRPDDSRRLSGDQTGVENELEYAP
jgi:hypothetical protein